MGVRGWSRSKHHEAAAAAMATGDRLLLMMQTYLARSSQQIKARRAATWQRAIGNLFLPQYSTSSILNYGSLNFFTLNLTARLIQKFMQNITYFVVTCFINTSSSRITLI